MAGGIVDGELMVSIGKYILLDYTLRYRLFYFTFFPFYTPFLSRDK